MDKLSKIFLVLIVILIIALVILSFLYFDMRKTAKENFNLYLKAQEKISLLIQNNPELQNTDLEALENDINK